MSKFVLDCSITMSWFFEDESDEYSDLIMDKLNIDGAVVPQIWTSEVVNALLVGEKKKRLQRTQSLWILEKLQKLPISVDDFKPNRLMSEILTLSGKHKLSAYDGAYLELALRLNLPLSTRDKALTTSAVGAGIRIV